MKGSAPRYLVMAGGARFGSRDEFVGYDYRVIGTAETYPWADRLIEREFATLSTEEAYMVDGFILDSVTRERVSREYRPLGPEAMPLGWTGDWPTDDDLPF